MAPSKLQAKASTENWALYQIKGMLGHLASISQVEDQYIQVLVLDLRATLNLLETRIKCIQSDRKHAKKKESKSNG